MHGTNVKFTQYNFTDED